MDLNEVDRLLDPAPLPLEIGYERLPSGVLHVAVRTDMHRCTGEMFEWWFRFRPDTQKYIWWHPVDHIFSNWVEGEPGTHIGSIHLVEERFGEMPPATLAIQFRDANEFFSEPAHISARQSGRLTAAVCGHVGFSHTPDRTEDGRVLGGRVLHIGRDTEWGCVLRSHFYMGQDLPALGKTPEEIAAILPDEFGQALLKHCYDEFTFLSRFLPSLYIAEHRDTLPVSTPC